MKRETVLRWVAVLLCIATMATIMAFSSQSAESSTELSRGLAEKLTATQKNASEAARKSAVAKRESFLRALAHFSLFLLLGVFASVTARLFGGKKRLWWVLPFCWLYALWDECYQYLLQRGRAFELVDIAKDCSGALVGFLLVWLVVYEYKKRRTA